MVGDEEVFPHDHEHGNKGRHLLRLHANMPKPSLRVSNLVGRMSLEEKIGQMSQIDLRILLDENNAIDPEKLEYYFGKLGIGSLMNSFVGQSKSAQDYRQVVIDIQAVVNKYKRPPVIWGLDSIHGANYIHGAILSPQPINLAATWNATTAMLAGETASRDTRAGGITWLLSPLLGIALEPNWSRVYETFGEDPTLTGVMAMAHISGIQKPEKGVIPSRAAACAKHFIGYSKPLHGHDRSPSWIPTRHLYQYFVPPWRYALTDKNHAPLTIMESYTGTDGVPTVVNPDMLKGLLRQQLQFDGVLVTDYSEILNLHNWHRISSSDEDATVLALRAGSVDMSMIPLDPEGFRLAVMNGVKNNLVSMERIDQSVLRVLTLKEQLGMMEETITMDNAEFSVVGEGRQDALDAAEQSIVLTKNEKSTLPLDVSDDIKIHVTGPTSNSLRYQSGGWTWQWQGGGGVPSNGENWFSYGTTIADAIGSTSQSWHVTASCGVDILGNECSDNENKDGWSHNSGVVDTVEHWIGLTGGNDDSSSIQRAADQASHSDHVVVCIGEENYAEKPGDIRSLTLPDGQYDLLRALKKTNANIILVYFGGRPRLLKDMVDIADAVLIGFLPGPDAGRAVANLIAGKSNPSGRLPITYPKFEDGAGAPYFHAVSDQCTQGDGELPHYNYVPCEVQWPFGHGLSYTTFQYSNLAVSTNTLRHRIDGQTVRSLENADDSLRVSVDIQNTGDQAGSEVAMFFTFDESRQVTPENKRLRAFEKVFLLPGESKTVSVTIKASDLRFVGADDEKHLILQHGLRFRVGAGSQTECRGEESSDLCSAYVTVDAGDDYDAACDAACKLWTESGCGEELHLSPSLCWDICTKNSNGPPLVGENGREEWGWNYVNCIENVLYSQFDRNRAHSNCRQWTSLCRNIMASPSVTTGATFSTDDLPLIFSTIAGLVGSAAIAFAFLREKFARREARSSWGSDDGGISFTALRTTDD